MEETSTEYSVKETSTEYFVEETSTEYFVKDTISRSEHMFKKKRIGTHSSPIVVAHFTASGMGECAWHCSKWDSCHMINVTADEDMMCYMYATP